MRKRRAPKHVWLVIYHGVGNTGFSIDFYHRYRTRKKALEMIQKTLGSEEHLNYEIVKYVRAESKGER